MDMNQVVFFCSGKEEENGTYPPIDLHCHIRTDSNQFWPITFSIGNSHYGGGGIMFHLVSLDQLLKFQESFNAAVTKAQAELRPASEIAAKMIALPSQLVVTKASELEYEQPREAIAHV